MIALRIEIQNIITDNRNKIKRIANTLSQVPGMCLRKPLNAQYTNAQSIQITIRANDIRPLMIDIFFMIVGIQLIIMQHWPLT